MVNACWQMLVRPEQVVAVATHGGSTMGNLRRAGEKGLSRKRLVALALALGASAAAVGGVQHRRAGQQAGLQNQLAGLTRGFGDRDAMVAQVASDNAFAGQDEHRGSMSEAEKRAWLGRKQAFQQSPSGQERAMQLMQARLWGGRTQQRRWWHASSEVVLGKTTNSNEQTMHATLRAALVRRTVARRTWARVGSIVG